MVSAWIDKVFDYRWVASLLLMASSVIGSQDSYTPKQDLDGLESSTEIRAGLPNVLLIGDSISIGYTEPTIELLRDVANVQRVKTNCGDTNSGLKNLKTWLGETRWDVIHFNWGLHDLCYRHPDSRVQGNRDKVNGTIAVPLDQYKKNLEVLVMQLKATGARLIWASTTVVPEGEAGRFVGDDVKYNAMAAEIMQKHGIVINDLHALSKGFGGKYSQPGNVHFDKEGSAMLAAQVAQVIIEQLGEYIRDCTSVYSLSNTLLLSAILNGKLINRSTENYEA